MFWGPGGPDGGPRAQKGGKKEQNGNQSHVILEPFLELFGNLWVTVFLMSFGHPSGEGSGRFLEPKGLQKRSLLDAFFAFFLKPWVTRF